MSRGAPRDIPGRRIALLGLAWAGLVIAAVIGVAALLRMLGMPWTQARAPGPRVEGPLQESAPQQALEIYLADKQARLNGLGWVDRRAGIAHIPIEDAMKLVASEPPPFASSPSGEPPP